MLTIRRYAATQIPTRIYNAHLPSAATYIRCFSTGGTTQPKFGTSATPPSSTVKLAIPKAKSVTPQPLPSIIRRLYRSLIRLGRDFDRLPLLKGALLHPALDDIESTLDHADAQARRVARARVKAIAALGGVTRRDIQGASVSKGLKKRPAGGPFVPGSAQSGETMYESLLSQATKGVPETDMHALELRVREQFFQATHGPNATLATRFFWRWMDRFFRRPAQQWIMEQQRERPILNINMEGVETTAAPSGASANQPSPAAGPSSTMPLTPPTAISPLSSTAVKDPFLSLSPHDPVGTYTPAHYLPTRSLEQHIRNEFRSLTRTPTDAQYKALTQALFDVMRYLNSERLYFDPTKGGTDSMSAREQKATEWMEKMLKTPLPKQLLEQDPAKTYDPIVRSDTSKETTTNAAATKHLGALARSPSLLDTSLSETAKLEEQWEADLDALLADDAADRAQKVMLDVPPTVATTIANTNPLSLTSLAHTPMPQHWSLQPSLHLRPGTVIASHPHLSEDTFLQSVILITKVDKEKDLVEGVLLNQPLRVKVEDLPDIDKSNGDRLTRRSKPSVTKDRVGRLTASASATYRDESTPSPPPKLPSTDPTAPSDMKFGDALESKELPMMDKEYREFHLYKEQMPKIESIITKVIQLAVQAMNDKKVAQPDDAMLEQLVDHLESILKSDNKNDDLTFLAGLTPSHSSDVPLTPDQLQSQLDADELNAFPNGLKATDVRQLDHTALIEHCSGALHMAWNHDDAETNKSLTQEFKQLGKRQKLISVLKATAAMARLNAQARNVPIPSSGPSNSPSTPESLAGQISSDEKFEQFVRQRGMDPDVIRQSDVPTLERGVADAYVRISQKLLRINDGVPDYALHTKVLQDSLKLREAVLRLHASGQNHAGAVTAPTTLSASPINAAASAAASTHSPHLEHFNQLQEEWRSKPLRSVFQRFALDLDEIRKLQPPTTSGHGFSISLVERSLNEIMSTDFSHYFSNRIHSKQQIWELKRSLINELKRVASQDPGDRGFEQFWQEFEKFVDEKTYTIPAHTKQHDFAAEMKHETDADEGQIRAAKLEPDEVRKWDKSTLDKKCDELLQRALRMPEELKRESMVDATRIIAAIRRLHTRANTSANPSAPSTSGAIAAQLSMDEELVRKHGMDPEKVREWTKETLDKLCKAALEMGKKNRDENSIVERDVLELHDALVRLHGASQNPSATSLASNPSGPANSSSPPLAVVDAPESVLLEEDPDDPLTPEDFLGVDWEDDGKHDEDDEDGADEVDGNSKMLQALMHRFPGTAMHGGPVIGEEDSLSDDVGPIILHRRKDWALIENGLVNSTEKIDPIADLQPLIPASVEVTPAGDIRELSPPVYLGRPAHWQRVMQWIQEDGRTPEKDWLRRGKELFGASSQMGGEEMKQEFRKRKEELSQRLKSIEEADAAAAAEAATIASAEAVEAEVSLPPVPSTSPTSSVLHSFDFLVYHGRVQWTMSEFIHQIHSGEWFVYEGSAAHVFTALVSQEQVRRRTQQLVLERHRKLVRRHLKERKERAAAAASRSSKKNRRASASASNNLRKNGNRSKSGSSLRPRHTSIQRDGGLALGGDDVDLDDPLAILQYMPFELISSPTVTNKSYAQVLNKLTEATRTQPDDTTINAATAALPHILFPTSRLWNHAMFQLGGDGCSWSYLPRIGLEAIEDEDPENPFEDEFDPDEDEDEEDEDEDDRDDDEDDDDHRR